MPPLKFATVPNKVKRYFKKEYKPYVIGELIKDKKNKILFNEKIKW